MLPALDQIRRILLACIDTAEKQGKVVEGLEAELAKVPDSYDALDEFSKRLAVLPQRDDWAYVEPFEYQEIVKEMATERPSKVAVPDAAARVEAAFLGRVCGCMLGKPVEVNPTLAELENAGKVSGTWPLDDYVSTKLLDALGRRERSWPGTCRENLVCAVPDDDISYTIMGMLLLEQFGPNFSRANQRLLWARHLTPGYTFGPERALLAFSTIQTLDVEPDQAPEPDWRDWLVRYNPGTELCGALIRVDAYAYAAAGDPTMASQLAWRDASYTHTGTGLYSAMFVAAALALMPVVDKPLHAFRQALAFVPQKSRFFERTKDCMEMAEKASDWESAYDAINKKYGEYTHCAIYMEIGTLMNSLRFAKDTAHAFCLQVMQGNDTDSFGATAGSMAALFFGPGKLEERWLKPLHNRLHTSLADFHEQDLVAVARRMATLPGGY